MIKRKILIASGAFYPENSPRSFRTTELVKEFARQGHQVTLIIPDKNAERIAFEKKHGISILDMGKQRFKPFKLSGSGIVRLITRALVRFPNLLFEYPDIQLMWMVKKALKNESGYDLLISIAVPHPIHWGVAWVRTAKRRIANVWVADCGDPYVGRENDTFKVPFYFSYIEKWFCRKTDFISVPTEGSVKGYFSEFHKKIRIIPQGFNFDEIELSEESSKNGVPEFAYAGLFIPGRRDPTEFLSFLLNLGIDFRFHIYTKSPGLVEPFLEKGKEKILIRTFIPRLKLLQELNKMDFLVNFENVGTKQTPSKLIDYAIIGKPILPVKTGNLNTTVVKEFLNRDYKNQYMIGDIDQYRIENVCEKFLQLLDEK